MSSTYRCAKLTIKELFELFTEGRDVNNELKIHKQFKNDYGSIFIQEDNFQNAYYITVELKNQDSIYIFPYLALIDVLANECELTSTRFINENKREFLYKDENSLDRFFNDNIVYVPKLMLKSI